MAQIAGGLGTAARPALRAWRQSLPLSQGGGLRSQALIGPAAAASVLARCLGRAPTLVGGSRWGLARLRLSSLRPAHRDRTRPLPSVPRFPGGGGGVDTRPPPGGWVSWAEVGAAGGRRGSHRPDWPLGPSNSPASAAPSSGRGRLHSNEPSCGLKAEGGKAGFLSPSRCGWGRLRGTFQPLPPHERIH